MKRARIAFNNGNISLFCIVKDLSGSGAQLTTDGLCDCPEDVELMFLDGPERFGFPMKCRVVWRNIGALGVRFQPN
jgi:hypothetical protein